MRLFQVLRLSGDSESVNNRSLGNRPLTVEAKQMRSLFTGASIAFFMNGMTLPAAYAMSRYPGNGHGHGRGNGNGHGWGNGGNPNNVPEIDASAGLLALAAVGAALILAWEVNRRRA